MQSTCLNQIGLLSNPKIALSWVVGSAGSHWDGTACAVGQPGAAVGAARWEGLCRTCPAQLIPKLAVGFCPPNLVLQPGSPSLGALKFIMGVWEPQGWEGTSHKMGEWDVRAWDGPGWVGGAGRGRNNLESQFERLYLCCQGRRSSPRREALSAGSELWGCCCPSQCPLGCGTSTDSALSPPQVPTTP